MVGLFLFSPFPRAEMNLGNDFLQQIFNQNQKILIVLLDFYFENNDSSTLATSIHDSLFNYLQIQAKYYLTIIFNQNLFPAYFQIMSFS